MTMSSTHSLNSGSKANAEKHGPKPVNTEEVRCVNCHQRGQSTNLMLHIVNLRNEHHWKILRNKNQHSSRYTFKFAKMIT